MSSVSLRRLRIVSFLAGLFALGTPVAAVAAPAEFSSPNEANEPFRPDMLLPSGGGPLAKWLDVWRKWNDEKQVIAACREDRLRCDNRAALELLAIVDNAKDLTGRAQLGQINRAVNLAIKAVSDFDMHGSSDVWSSPLETLARRAGDCEDYAIVKFAALLEVGVPAEDLRLVIVRDPVRAEDHAVVGVRHEEQWLMLDNRHFLMLADSQLARYAPLLLLQDHAARRYVAASSAPVERAPDPTAFTEPGAIAQ